MFNTKYKGKVYLYPPNRATIINGIKRKSKINPIFNLIGEAMHSTIEHDARRIRMNLLYVCGLFSKKPGIVETENSTVTIRSKMKLLP
jgi:hypothetical protein